MTPSSKNVQLRGRILYPHRELAWNWRQREKASLSQQHLFVFSDFPESGGGGRMEVDGGGIDGARWCHLKDVICFMWSQLLGDNCTEVLRIFGQSAAFWRVTCGPNSPPFEPLGPLVTCVPNCPEFLSVPPSLTSIYRWEAASPVLAPNWLLP